MARISFDADKDAESVGGGGNKFPAAPRGVYWLQVTDVSDGLKTSHEAKNPGVSKTQFVLEIADGEYVGTKVWHTVTWIPRGKGEKATPGHGMAVHWLHACKMKFDGQFDFDEQDFLEEGHCMVRALLEVEQYQSKDGKYTNEKNVIAQVYTENHPEPAELPAASKARATVGVTSAAPKIQPREKLAF
jgi:hypothetical protein